MAQNTNFGITTDFFTIGLDSLNIIQISSKIIEEFNIEIAPSQLYKLLNIEKLAKFLVAMFQENIVLNIQKIEVNIMNYLLLKKGYIMPQKHLIIILFTIYVEVCYSTQFLTNQKQKKSLTL